MWKKNLPEELYMRTFTISLSRNIVSFPWDRVKHVIHYLSLYSELKYPASKLIFMSFEMPVSYKSMMRQRLQLLLPDFYDDLDIIKGHC